MIDRPQMGKFINNVLLSDKHKVRDKSAVDRLELGRHQLLDLH
jgi:hypothetical protein